MPCEKYRRNKRFSSIVIMCSSFIAILVLLCSASLVLAGMPMGGEVYVYNVEPLTLSVVWQVDAPSTCDVIVYTDNGVTQATGYATLSNTNNSATAQACGIMQVDVSGLLAETTYYIQTKSNDGTQDYFYPAAGSLKQVKTEAVPMGPPTDNGSLFFALYDSQGINPADALDNILSDVVIIIEVDGANSPKSSDTNGWPVDLTGTGGYITQVNFAGIRKGTYWDWITSPANHPMTIRCFGGQVPGVGKGQRVIHTTFPSALVGSFGCLSDAGITDLDGCDTTLMGFGINQIVVYPNQPPQFDLNANYNVDRGALLTINVCAHDPEGDPIQSITLGGTVPSGMNILFPAADANCATITWTPALGGFFPGIQVLVSDGTATTPKTFQVTALHGPPSTPTVSIAPTTADTDAPLICTVVPGSVVNPDAGETSYLDYKWYSSDSAVTPIFQELNTVGQFQSTLNASYTQKNKSYYCKVTAHDVDGSATPAETAHVTILSTPPATPAGAAITPANTADVPKATQDLTCTVTPAAVPDIDGDTVTYKFYWQATGKTPVDSGYIASTTHVLTKEHLTKGDTWTCTVTAYDGSSPSTSSATSNSVTIKNSLPKTPGEAAITPANPTTGSTLTCTVTPAAAPIDDDASDVAGMKYEYTWFCTDCGGKADITHAAKTGTTDTLADSETKKGQQWSCKVWAVDGSSAKSAGFATALAVTIQNTAPTGLAANVTPVTSASTTENLVCHVTGVTDPDVTDGADTIQYKYVWTEQGGTTVTHDFSAANTDTLNASNTSQGQTWHCVVTAQDGSTAEIQVTTNSVNIVNQAPTVTTVPAEAQQTWDEETEYTIQVNATDPDGNNLIYGTDPNYVLPAWASFNSTTHVLTATPPSGSSSEVGNKGVAGVYKFNFLVTDDGTPPQVSEKLITATVQAPSTIVDDFDTGYGTSTTLNQMGWFWLQGSGQMLRKVDPADPNNHYLQTTVTTTPSNNSQLNYIVTKYLDENVFTYPELHFFIKDTNLYYFDAYVRGVQSGVEKNYFLRYVPQDPASTYTVSGKYITYKIGAAFLNANGVEVVRNMENDLFQAVGHHFVYLSGILLRGDVNYLDNILVSPGIIDKQAPKDVKNLVAQGGEGKVFLQWQLDPNQSDDIGGYNIYMDTAPLAAKNPAKLKGSVDPNAVAYTATGLTNGTPYHFLVTAFDTSAAKNESAGKTASATPQQDTTPPLDPQNLAASSDNRNIILTWQNPANQHLDLYGYWVYYCDCSLSDCNTCVKTLVLKSAANATGQFTKTITADASGADLEYGNRYWFTVKATDNAATPNHSSGVVVSTVLVTPPSKVIDDFDTGYTTSTTLTQKGWYKLQGSGTFTRKLEGSNDFLRVTSGYSSPYILNYVVTKWLDIPQDYTNPEFMMLIRSLGDFRVDVYVRGTDGNNYFLSYKGDKNATQDTNTPTVEQTRWFVYNIAWKNKASSTAWAELVRDLDFDLMTAKNVHFDYALGIIVRGTGDFDDIELQQTVTDVKNLTARPGDQSVLLSWMVEDPNQFDATKLYKNGALVDSNIPANRIAGTNDFTYLVSGLTNGTSYELKVVKVSGTEESRGATVQAKPRAYKSMETFNNLANWTLIADTGSSTVSWDVLYSTDVQSSVMYLNPTHSTPERFWATTDPGLTGVTGMNLRIKTDSNFVIWVDMTDTTGLPFMLAFVPGGTADTYVWHGWLAYYNLGSGYTDGKWHYMDLNFDTILNKILGAGVGANKVEHIFIGGKIYADDLGFY